MYLYPCKPNSLTPDSRLFEELDRDIGWIAEVKKNGWRAPHHRWGRQADDVDAAQDAPHRPKR